MAKNKKQSNKVTFLGCDYVETPREIIEADKNTARKKAFLEAYKHNELIVPEFFIKNKKKRKNSSGSSGGKGFAQNIIVTPEKVEIETMETEQKQVQDEREREE